jgi:hypothetical protein
MKRTLLFVGFVLLAAAGFAAFKAEKKQTLASEISFNIGSASQSVSLADFVELKEADYETLTGKKLGFFGKMQFHQQQRSLRKLINSDGTIDDNEVSEKAYKNLDSTKGFNLTGFMMGLTLSVVGVLIMYLVKDERRKNRATWAWVGAAFWVAFLLLIIAVV